jgi:hypothetical protein
MPEIIEADNRLEIQDKTPPLKRLVFVLLALFPLLAPYELLIEPDWNEYLHFMFFFALIVSAGALAVTVFFFWAAIAGMNVLMRFDKENNTFTYMWDAPVFSIRKFEHPLKSIKLIDIEKHEWSDSPPSYSLRIETEDGKKFTCGSSGFAGEIEKIKDRVISFLNL